MDTARPAYLFHRYFEQTATEEEKAELMKWISREGNIEKAKELMDKTWEGFQEKGVVFTDIQSKDMLRHILERKHKPATELTKNRTHKNFHLVKVAAVILVLFATGSYFLFFNKQVAIGQREVVLQERKKGIIPGGNRAVLRLANGTMITLDSVNSGILSQQGNTNVIKVNNGLLTYNRQRTLHNERQRTGNTNLKVKYNTLKTPRGGQFQLILPDGTKVWLNAASSIRFPTAFTGQSRNVEITGEAYFEVAENASKPFFVQVNDLHIKVLGTHFNVNAYTDEPFLKTTLVEGSIKVVKGDSKVILKPGQIATVGKSKNNIHISKANIDEAIAWKNGLFHFNGEDMQTIMHKIARWYDVKVVYKGGIPDGHYTGIISRNTNLSQVLEILKLSGIQFKIQGRKLIVLHPNHTV